MRLGYRKMSRCMLRNGVLALLVFGSAFGARATVDSGMVLLYQDVPGGKFGGGKIMVKYLSTGKVVTIQNGGAAHAVFSDDGRRIAFGYTGLKSGGRYTRCEKATINVDGSDRRFVYAFGYGGANAFRHEWCSNGYLYLPMTVDDTSRIVRIPENGGDIEVVHTFGEGVYSPEDSSWVAPGGGSFHMSRDGRRYAATSRRTEADGSYGGYAQFAVDLETHEEFSPWRPCQGSISGDGQILSVSSHAHRAYRFARWPVPYQEFGTNGEWGNTYAGCEAGPYDELEVCPSYDTVVHTGFDLRDMFDMGENIPEQQEPQFSNCTNDIFMFGISEKITDERVGGAWLYQFSTHEYTKVAPIHTQITGYCPTEHTFSTPYVLAPGYTLFYVDTTGALPGAKPVTLSSAEDMPGAPTLSNVPAWLNVEVSRVSAREYTLACTVVGNPRPDVGTYPDTMYVTPGGSTEPLQMLVTLLVDEHPELPIMIATPRDGQVYRVGDTLRVEYSADSTLMSGTRISLSVDAGDTWVQMHSDAAWETGSNQELKYAIPSSVEGRSLVSEQCLVMISGYPDGYETYSGVFSIVGSATSSTHERREPTSAQHALRVALKRSASVPVLTVTSPTSGVARLIDLRGRTVRSFTLAEGAQGVGLPSLQAGRYLLEISLATGIWRTVVVDAF